MPVPNSEYNPEWEALYDHHEAERKRLQEEAEALTKHDHELYNAGNTAHDSPERLKIYEKKEKLYERINAHNQVCQDCLSNYQHKTIQDAARWVFQTFDPDMGSLETHTVHQIDLEQFTTIEEVGRAWAAANETSKQIEAEKTQSLPRGRPDGKNIFEKTGTNKLSSGMVHFDVTELRPDTHQYVRINGCDVFITIDERDGEYHICFTQDRDMERSGMWMQYEIENLATVMYRRAYASQKQESKLKQLPGAFALATGMRSLMAKFTTALALPVKTNPPISPDQFHFYVHHTPKHLQKEMFIAVNMKWKSGKFVEPEFNRLNAIPETIPEAYNKTRKSEAQAKIVSSAGLLPATETLDFSVPS